MFTLSRSGWKWGNDTVAIIRGLGVNAGKATWQIPIEYKDDAGKFQKTSIVSRQVMTFDGQGGCTISKCGVTVTRVPKDKDTYNKDPKNYRGDFEYK
jgi:hypothetical protein